MRNIIYLLVGFVLFTTSCEDPIDVDLDNITPRLVVEGDIEWEKGTSGNVQTIRLSESTDFFENDIRPVMDAQVVMNQLSTGTSYLFTHIGDGIYETSDFQPVIDEDYELLITSAGQNFRAVERLYPVPEVDRIEQNMVEEFNGEEEISIDLFAQDPAGIENYYLLTHFPEGDEVPFISIWDDKFIDGNEITFIYRQSFGVEEEELASGSNVEIEFMAISEDYANFMLILTEQAYGGFGPFSTTPVALKGNVANLTNPDENAFGFFRLSEKVTSTVIIE